MGTDIFKGTLIPIGGNEDKGRDNDELHTLDFIENGILSRVVKEAGGNDSYIVVLPTASSIPVEVGQNYKEAFGKLGCDHVEILNIRNSEHATDHIILKKLEQADCIMFSGGDQSKIVDAVRGNAMHELLKYRLKNDDVVIAGTSAGAMAMADEMIAGGKSADAFFKGNLRMRKGLGLIPELMLDSHFIQRGRFGRVAEAIARYPDNWGVGLAEDTGLVIKNRNEAEVIGSGMVIIFDGSELSHNNHDVLDVDTPMSISNIKVHILANSDRFMIDRKELFVLPLEAEFNR